MDDEDVDDWDVEFGFADDAAFTDDDSNVDEADKLISSRIIGITADRLDPLLKETDWGDDFELGDANNSLFASKVKKSASIPEGLHNVLEQMANEEEDTKDADATSASGEGEDWDKEFGIETEEDSTSLFANLRATANQEKVQQANELPENHRFLQEKSGIRIFKFPLPTLLYSLHEKENYRIFNNEKDLVSWLSNVVSKHKVAELISTPSVDEDSEALATRTRDRIARLDPGCDDWCDCLLQACSTLCRRGDKRLCAELLNEFVAGISKAPRPLKADTVASTELMFYYACRTWSQPQDEEGLSNFARIASEMDPSLARAVSILKLEAYAHHTEDPSAIERFCELFAQIDTNKELAQEIRNTAAVQVLTDIHLFLNGASPLTSKKLKDYDGFDDVHDSSNNARASRGFVAVGESRSTAASSASSSASGAAAGAGAGTGAASAMAAANRVALNNTLRVQRLSDLYLTLPPSFVKAKAAFALGLNAQNSGHHQQAERLYFEAIYLLDGCSPTGRPTAPLISELGANCLKSYGDQLLYNYKYKYAIAAYQSCSISYQLRRRNKDYYYLLKEMAATAYRNDDVKHAIPFYKEVLQICITEKKTNEVIYVSDVLSKIYAEIGKFHVAEEFLLGAFSRIAPNDPQAFSIRLKLAQLYLKGFHPERGIRLLRILRTSSPQNKQASILVPLIKACIRKRRYKEVSKLLEALHDTQTGVSGHSRTRSHVGQGGTLVGGQGGASGLGGSFGGGGSGGAASSNAKRPPQHWELYALNYYHAKRYREATFAVDNAIAVCPAANLSSLGKFYYLRGKIFQALARANGHTFPTMLRPEGQEAAHGYYFRCKGDMMQETISTYRRAYHYFGVVGDQLWLSKTVCRIAETYLEPLFAPVALLQKPLDSVNRFPAYVPTPVARRAGDAVDDPDADLAHTDDFILTMAHIEGPATLALNIASEISIPLLLLKCYLNMAELRFLQGAKVQAMAYWNECRTALVNLFVVPILGKSAPATLLRKLLQIVGRAVRFLFCQEGEVINKNLFLIDAYNELEARARNAERKAEPTVPEGSDLRVLTTLHNMKSKIRLPCAPVVKQPSLDKPPPTSRKDKRMTRRIVRQSTIKNVRMLFGTEGLDPNGAMGDISDVLGMVPSEGGSYTDNLTEDIAEYVWNCLHCIKAQLSKYSDGKLTKEEVFYNNQKYLRKLSKLIAERYVHISSLLSPPPITSDWGKSEETISQKDLCSEGVAFEVLSNQYRRLKRVMYVLKLESLVYVYVPSTSERKIRQMGVAQEGKHAPVMPRDVSLTVSAPAAIPTLASSLSPSASPSFEHGSGSSGGGSGSSSADLHGIEKRMFYVKLHLMCSVNEWSLFVVKRGVTLQALLDYVCDLPSAGLGSDTEAAKKSAKRGLFNSFSRTTTKALKMPMRYVEGSKNFIAELANVMAICDTLAPGRLSRSTDQSLLTSSAPASGVTISFAVKTRQGQDSYLSPMTGCLDQTFEQCFAMEDTNATHPLSLHIFVTSSMPPVSELVGNAKQLSSDTFEFSKDTMDYVAALITGADLPFEDDPASLKAMVEGLFSNSFSWFVNMVPEGGVKRRKPTSDFPFQEALKNTTNAFKPISRSPLSLICSRALQAIPWELILNETVVRYINLNHAVNREYYLQEEKFAANHLVLPRYNTCFYATYDKSLQTMEDNRKRSLAGSICAELRLAETVHSTPSRSVCTLPFHSPLIKQGATKKVKFGKLLQPVELSRFLSNPAEILTTTDKLQPHEYPMFILTYSDLVELNDATLELIRLKSVWNRIGHIHDKYLREKARLGYDFVPNQYQYVINVISALQQEQPIPITVVNMP